jgi:large subunit ribosomal protein L35
MPKMKTNRTAYRKFRVGGTGTVKKGCAFTSHNTSKRGAKRRRTLRGRKVVDATNVSAVQGMLPSMGIK